MSHVTTETTAFNAQVAAETVEMSSAISMSSARWYKPGKASRQDIGVSACVSASNASPGNGRRSGTPAGCLEAASGPRFFLPGT